MLHILRKSVFALCALMAIGAGKSMAANGDTTVVQVFQDQVIITNPNTGSNPYSNWGVFPGSAATYNKVLMYLTFECPDNMPCAEWDYLDPISIKRPNGMNSTPLNWEFARFITPYGLYWGAGSSFKHGWYYDVTDFATLFHDSVEIEYNHTGYEGTHYGWKINMTFLLIEGTPEREVKNITRIYSGGYGYNSNIETNLSAQSVTYGANTQEARVKIIQSGHGMNDQNCSEFCPKQRWVKYDNNTINQRLMWRECGFNSLYPQAGTWLYDRGNWCPGASVRYDDLDIHGVTPNTTHTFDIDMETVGAGNFGTQVITAYVIEYGAPNYATDVSLEAILAPSNEHEATRLNPICAEPIVVIKNNGTNPLTSVNIVYGVPGGVQSTYAWTGNLPYLGVDTVRINQAVNWSPNSNVFQVDLQNPNNTTDQCPYNNYNAGAFTSPDVFGYDKVIIDFKTNLAPSENRYIFMDMTTGTVLSSKNNFTATNTLHKDTISLSPGHCYSFEFYDDGPPPGNLAQLNNDGLSWWANNGDGGGTLQLKRISSPFPIKTFNPDFGTKVLYQFMCLFPLAVNEVNADNISMIVSPNPSHDGNFSISYTLPEAGATLEVYNMVGMRVHRQQLSQQFGETNVSLKELPKGAYIIKVTSKGNLVHTQRVISN
ncbi:MAG: T9SS type A sorting domain-containing protein [Flavipsychrobacter sp.]|nr:T9SS type A sorting domain-containing protein [Flavipsychrobacter sp.]